MFVSIETMRSAVQLVGSLAEATTPDEYARRLLPGLIRLVPCDAASYHEVNANRVYRREFHRLPHQRDFFRPLPDGYQVVVTLERQGSSVAAVVLNRAGRDFTDLEREILSIVREPLRAARQRVRIRSTALDAANATVGLSDRERQVLELVAAGRTNVAIGRALRVSPRTVAKHLEHVYAKLDVTCRAEAVGRVQRGPVHPSTRAASAS